MKDISRREFLRYVGIGTIGLIVKPNLSCTKKIEDDLRSSDVVQCFDENATTGSSINESVVQIMMDASIKQLTGINDVGNAWKSIFPGITEDSVISIKVNAINEYVPAHPKFVNCIVNGLAQMQFGTLNFRRNNIIIWDRTDWQLTDADYTIYDGNDANMPRCFGTNHSGVGYDYNEPLNVHGVTSYPSRILSEMSDYLINAAVLKNHDRAQVTFCMKNHYGSVNNPGSLHGGYCSPYLPSLNQQIRDEITPNNIQKIFIIDALWGSILYGPGGGANCNPKKLIMSLDTVACDYRGWELINEERAAHGWTQIQWPIHHIETAAQSPYNLGSTDVNLIEVNNPSAIKESSIIDSEDNILNITPNPFRKRTTVFLTLPKTSTAHLDLINPAGRIAENIYAGTLSAGPHRIEYNVNKVLSSGNYFFRLYYQGNTTIKKVTVLN